MANTVPARATRRRLDLDDYLALPDDGMRYEIIDGELFMSASPIARHQVISMNLVLLLAGLQRKFGGRVLAAPIDVVLGPHDIVVPDIIYVRKERLAIIGEARVDGAPDLIVEILSPSTRDRDLREKAMLYAKSGVASYWIVDPVEETVTLHRLKVLPVRRGTAQAYHRVADLVRPAIGLPQEFPGFKLPLARVFAR